MADYTDLRGRFVYKRPVYWTELDILAENDSHLKDNGWEDGCQTVFFQAAAPTGWTRVTTADLNGRTLRIVSGSGGVTGGGSQSVGATITLAHTHTISTSGAHTHTDTHVHALTQGATSGGYSSAFPPQTNLIPSVLDGEYIRQWKMHPTTWATIVAPALYTWTTAASRTTSSGGDHNHGGVSNSLLTDVSLAYVDILVCSKDVDAGYTDLTSYFEYGDDIGTAGDNYFDVFGENDDYNKTRLIPAGTVSLFCQDVAPSGWTKVLTHHDKATRIVTGGSGGGSGGTADLSDEIVLIHGGIDVSAGGRTHTVTAEGSHAHTTPDHTHTLYQADTGGMNIDPTLVKEKYFSNDGSSYMQRRDGTAVSETVLKGTTDSSGAITLVDPTTSWWLVPAHDHQFSTNLTNVTLAYLNAIICQKDAYDFGVYTDMSAFFVQDNLLAYQDMEALTQNDENINNQQMPAGAIMFFYQAAAPLTWTKSSSQNDKVIRIVNDGSGGGTGGSAATSSSITLAHTHTIDTKSHTHKVPSHSTSLLTGTVATAGNLEADYFLCYGASGILMAEYCYATPTKKLYSYFSVSSNAEVSTGTHNHGGSLASSLTNITLSYADVIMCQKD